MEDILTHPVDLWEMVSSKCKPIPLFKEAYIGSANLTGAGKGMKSGRRRNFEAGFLTDDPALVAAAMDHFDSVWAGFRCRDCGRKEYCGDPIVK